MTLCKDFLDRVGPANLTLWKLTPPLPTGRTEAEKIVFYQKIKAIEFPDTKSNVALLGNGTVQLLEPDETLSTYWPENPETKHLHFLVQVPSASRAVKRRKLEDYTFECLCIDDGWKLLGSIFPVRVKVGNCVIHLKRAVKAAMTPLLTHLSVEQLDIRKVLSPLPYPTGPEEEFAAKVKNASLSDTLGQYSTLSSHWQTPDELQQIHLHIIVRVPSIMGNITNALLQNWNMPAPLTWVPDITSLKGYLTSPLELRKRIPLMTQQWQRLLCEDVTLPQRFCSDEDLETLFTQNNSQTSSFEFQLLSLIFDDPNADTIGTESSFHSIWDANIRNVLKTCLIDCVIIRESSKGTNTSLKRPDFGLLLRNACIFRGEEKPATHSALEARDELISKTRWAYDPAPYVLGYYASGYSVTYCTISYNKDLGANIVEDIITVNLSLRKDRIRNAVLIIHLVSILRGLENLVSEGVDKCLIPRVMGRPDGKFVTIFTDSIQKHYTKGSEERVEWLSLVYNALKTGDVPNVDRLKKIDGLDVWLEPVGDLDHRAPRSEEDVKNAVKCVLETLEVIHEMEPPIFHRDIRWDNVIRNKKDENKWLLIDWEDSAMPPTEAASNMNPDTHSPRVFKDGHGAEVDLWSVGRLILTALPPLSGDLISLGKRMRNGTIESAAQGLRELKSL